MTIFLAPSPLFPGWSLVQQREELVETLSQSLNIRPLTARLLINRGLSTEETASAFLQSSPDFTLHRAFSEMNRAAAVISYHVKNRQKIVIFGDYDSDGVTGVALLVLFLRKVGAVVEYYIPERLTEGYGLNLAAMGKLAEAGASLIITVDTGISNVEEIRHARSLGLDVVVSDHHEIPKNPPPATAIINPKELSPDHPIRSLSGVGVAYQLALAVADEIGMDSKEVEEFLDLVAVGTIGDISSLTGENRALVKRGLEVINQRPKPWVKALAAVGGLQVGGMTSEQVAFGIVPRINAVGRLEKADAALHLLTTGDEGEAFAYAEKLHQVNTERQELCKRILEEASSDYESLTSEEDKVIVLAREGWHPGVIGVVASQLMEKYGKPVILMGVDGDKARGSARSMGEFHLYHLLEACKEYLLHFGGHKLAAGFSISAEQIEPFSRRVKEISAQHTFADRVSENRIDAMAAFSEVDEQFMLELNLLEPFGEGNPQPLLATSPVQVRSQKKIGKTGDHLKLFVESEGRALDGVAFRKGKSFPLPREIGIIYTPKLNTWNGRTSIQLTIEEILK